MKTGTRAAEKKPAFESSPWFVNEKWLAARAQQALYSRWIREAMVGPVDAEECEYVAGPMRGYNLWNFPAFDRRRDQLVAEGKRVVSPADLDRVRGFTEHMTEFPPCSFSEAMGVDITSILYFCTGIDLLPGWSQSTGARYEWCVAEALGKRIRYAPGAEKMVLAITPVDIKVGTGVTE